MTVVDVVIMAAGKGTRMRSRRPKVLHRLAGRGLIDHVLRGAAALQPRSIVLVTGHGADEVEGAVRASGATPEPAFVRQEPQLGTGHAVQQAVPRLADDGVALILNGDVPLIQPQTLQALVDACGGERLALLGVELPDPTGYGRIVRQGERVVAIVEHKDATEAQRGIREVYTGFMAVPNKLLKRWLGLLTNDNAQGEYYLTDLVKHAVAEGAIVVAVDCDDRLQVEGVNSPVQLAQLERAFQLRNAGQLMEQGVRLADPARLDVRGTLHCAQDVEIDVGCVFEGHVVLGDGVRIGPNCVIANATIDANAVIKAFTHIEGESRGGADRRARRDRPVRAAAARRATRARGAHRQLRRGQELHARARCQGQPPGLPGRCPGRGEGELRRRFHHRQLRRREQAPHGDRGRGARGQQLRARGAGAHRARRHRGRRLHDHHATPSPGCCRSRGAGRPASADGSGR